MTVYGFLKNIEAVDFPLQSKPVYETTAEELRTILNKTLPNDPGNKKCLKLRINENNSFKPGSIRIPEDKDWGFVKFNKEGSGEIIVSKPYLLFSICCYLNDYLKDCSADDFYSGKIIEIGFKWNRTEFDSCLTQFSRTARNFDWKSHIKEYARLGYSHVEVNSLATPHGMEPCVPGETYSVFYTYCACPDQFVHSKLNKGFYPAEYLSANLSMLKKYSQEAIKYGMTPGIHSFEPRNVPEDLLKKYPTLRGGRTDHPFRSWKPRFNLTIAHPFVRMHYKELIQKLLKEVPEMGYMSIVTNDSGAGFEYTRSLYVGANGGPYLIREWKSVDEVAQASGANVMRFFKLLRDSASAINPDFRIIFKLEPFGSEREYILKETADRLDIAGGSFLHKGYTTAYRHEKYEDVETVQGTLWQTEFKKEEKEFMDTLQKKNSIGHVVYSAGGYGNFDPLIGIPSPWMIHKKFKAMRDTGADYVAQLGGVYPKSLAPWCINREVQAVFQHDPEMDINSMLKSAAEKWAGPEFSEDLYKCWELIHNAVSEFMPGFVYGLWGMTWYRLWSRPIIPDIEKIPEDEREYYERFLLATKHNPARIDFNQDVLFELGGPELAAKLVDRMDKNLFPELKKALEFLAQTVNKSKKNEKASKVFADLYDRIRGLECWITTQRNVQMWIAGVHGYLQSEDKTFKAKCRADLKDMVLSEIENTKKLLDLWETSKTDFMLISRLGESVHQLGDNLGEHLKKKIKLMTGHENDEPRVDPNFMWRVPEIDFYSLDDMDV